MTRMTGPDCAVMCNLINIHTYMHTYIHTYIHTYMCNLINIHTYIHTWYVHTYIHTYVLEKLYRNWQQKNDAYCSLVQLRKVDHRIVPRNFEPHSHSIEWNNVPIYATSLYKNHFHEQTMYNAVHYTLHRSKPRWSMTWLVPESGPVGLTHHFRSIR